jgi:hypothetical protein
MAVIRAAHYGQTVEALKQDPIIQQMANELFDGWSRNMVNPFETWLMMRALDMYKDRGGTVGSHIGGPIEAVRDLMLDMLLKQERVTIDLMSEAEKADPQDVEQVKLLRRAYSSLMRMKVQVVEWQREERG